MTQTTTQHNPEHNMTLCGNPIYNNVEYYVSNAYKHLTHADINANNVEYHVHDAEHRVMPCTNILKQCRETV